MYYWLLILPQLSRYPYPVPYVKHVFYPALNLNSQSTERTNRTSNLLLSLPEITNPIQNSMPINSSIAGRKEEKKILFCCLSCLWVWQCSVKYKWVVYTRNELNSQKWRDKTHTLILYLVPPDKVIVADISGWSTPPVFDCIHPA